MVGVPGGHPETVLGAVRDDLACPACRGALADRYDRLLPRLYAALGTHEQAVRTQLLARLGLRPGGRVLLVGAGTGRDLRHLHRATAPGGVVVGVDRSGAMLRVSRRKMHHQGTPVSLIRAGWRLPFKDGRFDAVLQVGAVDPDDPGPALAELNRVARPGAPQGGPRPLLDGPQPCPRPRRPGRRAARRRDGSGASVGASGTLLPAELPEGLTATACPPRPAANRGRLAARP